MGVLIVLSDRKVPNDGKEPARCPLAWRSCQEGVGAPGWRKAAYESAMTASSRKRKPPSFGNGGAADAGRGGERAANSSNAHRDPQLHLQPSFPPGLKSVDQRIGPCVKGGRTLWHRPCYDDPTCCSAH
jgi:hypothetical protein